MKRRQLLGAAGVIMAGTFAGCTRVGSSGEVVTDVVEDTFDPATVETVQVTNGIGDVTIRERDVEQVTTRIVKRSTNGREGLNDIRTSASVSGDTLTVRTRIDRNAIWFSRSSPQTDLTITVPEGEAAPRIEQVTSELGNVTLLDTRGDTTVRTQLGDVIARRVDGYPALESQLGTIVASGTTGLRDVSTNLGKIDIELRDVRGDTEIRTDLGEILVTVATDLAIDIVARSDSRISSTLELDDSDSSDGRLTGQFNGGGPRVRIVSDLGDIALRPLTS